MPLTLPFVTNHKAITHQPSLKAWLCPLKTPKQVEKMIRGSYNHRFEVNDEVLIVRWKDNKAVGIAVNFDKILLEVSVQRWSSESKSRIPIVQPCVIQTYNKHMGGVDHHN